MLENLKLDTRKALDIGTAIVRGIGDKMTQHGPEMLAVTAVVGVVTTAVLVAKETPKALERRSKRPVDVDEAGELAETPVKALINDAKVMAPVYLPAILTGAGTIACIIGGNRLQADNYAKLAAAYSVTEQVAMKVQKEVVDRYGQDVHDEIMAKVTDEGIDECPFDDAYIVNSRSNGDTLFYDAQTGMVFWCTPEKLQAAEGMVSKAMVNEGPQTVCDLYSYAGIRDDEWESGKKRGWTVNGYGINLRMSSSTLEPDGRIPKRVLSYHTDELAR